jgi:hypothetical protein
MDAAKIKIQVNFQQLIEAVKQPSPKEKLKLNELIWEDNCAIPIEHQDLVMYRINKTRKNHETMFGTRHPKSWCPK